ncbi:hypothetical protein KY285_016711 [Solanum tuberosum]|nr:hypothetical protein KY284_018619 [Solanum tuberosum]KAH0689552.1 hypothetical protein KY289_016910 [Solanum tuberosum]KAH0702433.1 hypothetical protein KY285_016711 [Solanum tuberosum]
MLKMGRVVYLKEGCNITNTVKWSSKGNTSFPITVPGDSYFICGNRLHCLGGMKLDVNVEDNINKMASPASPPLPQAGASNFPTHSSKTNNPSTMVPRLANLPNQVDLDSVLVATLGFPIDSFISICPTLELIQQG